MEIITRNMDASEMCDKRHDEIVYINHYIYNTYISAISVREILYLIWFFFCFLLVFFRVLVPS